MMSSPRQIVRSHEEIFIERYGWLLAWALRLTENNRERAEDLVQEAFIHFTLARPDIEAISNFEGYLYSMLRNLHLSQERRATRNRLQQLSVFEYDTIEAGLRVAGSLDRLQVQQELRRVCHYACVRKESARAASLLILRFFHGYYPSEIAQVARTNRRAVDERLRIARGEAKLYVNDPGRLKFIADNNFKDALPARPTEARATDEFLIEMRRMIFRSRRGECPSQSRLAELYLAENDAPIGGPQLAHIVSCPTCLDAVNKLLNLPDLNDRWPTDTLGKDSPTGGGGREGGGAGGGEILNKYRRSAREVFEHRPQELYFLINGLMLGSHTVNSEWSEQTLDINLAERIGFVEVFSERDTRLFFFNVEPPPDGPVQQPARMELSDGRSLDLTLSFTNNWPTLHAVYHDPLMNALPLLEEEISEAAEAAFVSAETLEEQRAPRESAASRLLKLLVHFWHRLLAFFSPRPFLRPGLITALVAVALISALVLVKMRAPAETSAAELLQKSVAAQEQLAANADLVLHQKTSFEERRGSNRELVARYNIDAWQSAARELKVRRVYDEQGNLFAGEWTKNDGSSMLYSHGREPQQRTAPERVAGALIETGEIWRLDASAQTFYALVGHAQVLTIEESPDTYVLRFQSERQAAKGALINAALALRKSDLRAVEQRLVVERDGEVREYKFTEELFERYPKAHVAHTTFQPEPALLGTSSETKNTGDEGKTQAAPTANAPLSESEAGVASAELEIEVSYLLNRIKADLGEQVSLTRTTGGALRVEALVETERRKEEILRALGPVLNNRAVIVRVSTIDEALSRQQGKPKTGSLTEREVEIQTTRIPADAELRRYFTAQSGSDAQVDEKINQFANRMLGRSRQARIHASQLQRLVARFSSDEIRALTPEARAKWLGMIRGHARDYRREVALLRQELRLVFLPASLPGANEEAVTEANLAQSATRLAALSHSVDEAVRSAFTISADQRTAAEIKSAQFWRSLVAAERLAASIENVYQ